MGGEVTRMGNRVETLTGNRARILMLSKASTRTPRKINTAADIKEHRIWGATYRVRSTK